jgi:flagellar basal body rod protein FlgC
MIHLSVNKMSHTKAMMILASRSYYTNVQLVELAKNMFNKTLTLGQR